MKVGDLVQSKRIPENIGVIVDSTGYGKKTRAPLMIHILLNGKIKWSKIKYFEVINENKIS